MIFVGIRPRHLETIPHFTVPAED